MRLEELNTLGRAAFVEAIGWVYEHSPWVAEEAWEARPFLSLSTLCESMSTVVRNTGRDKQLALLCAHPDLGTRAKVGQCSENEQAGAGLDKLTTQEYERLLRLNSDYKERFGFPFLYAVKGSTKFMILDAMEGRLNNDAETEFATALQQVDRIARFRLEDTLK